ncbi:hypothetical protein NCC49_004367 [Naganishia albida]|nr:hypothetical protein NCC49_004367 [Naganishia albida]
MPPRNLMRCLCHIANLAAIDYLKAEAKLKKDDYQYNPDAVPEMRVLRESDFHSTDELEEVLEVQELESVDAMAGRSSGNIPLGGNAETKFESVRKEKNPTSAPNCLPLKDVPTRWNSKEAAIRRILKLRATVKTFCMRYKSEHCPQLTDDAFRILELIQPDLAVFARLTATYSPTSNIHIAIGDLHDSITDLKTMHDHISLTAGRRERSTPLIVRTA